MKSGWKHFILKICILSMLIASCWTYYKANQEEKIVYGRMKEDAEFLAELNCEPKECIIDGEIKYIKTSNGRSRSLVTKAMTYYYEYSFITNNTTYSNTIEVYGEPKRVRWLPTAEITLGKTFKEKIKFDPNNPSVNLPLAYISIIPQIPNPYDRDRSNAILWLILAAIFAFGYIKEKNSAV